MESGITDVANLDSKNSPGICIADFFIGLLMRISRSIRDDLRKSNNPYNTRKKLSKN